MRNKIWKTVQLGQHSRPAEYGRAITKQGMIVSRTAGEILNQVVISQEAKLSVIRVAVRELGLKKGGYYQEIQDRALARGLKGCPAEIGPVLRLAYVDQPRHERLHIAMEALSDQEKYHFAFALFFENKERELGVYSNDPQSFWSGDSEFIFVRNK